MNISIVEESLKELGVEFTKKGETLNVKLGGYSSKVRISYDLSKQALSYSYFQTQFVLLSLLFIIFSITSIGSGDYLHSGVELAMAFGLFINVIITEIKITDLKRSIRNITNEVGSGL